MRFTFIALIFALTACSQEELLERFSSKEEQAAAKAYIEQLRSRDFAALEQNADQNIKTANMRGALEKMAGLIPQGTPTSITLVGAHRFSNADSTTTNTTFEYGFGDQWFLINVAIRDAGGTKTIAGLNVVPQPLSLEAQNKFSLAGKTTKHYAVLGAAIVAGLLSLFALVVCVRTKLSGKKWPWVLFIILGIGKLGINWSTGEILFAPLSLQIFSASATAAFYGPWLIHVSLPVGAVAFLLRRNRLARPIGS